VADQDPHKDVTHQSAGVILICDIVDFSLQSIDVQYALVKRLWSITRSHRVVNELGDRASFNSTGDGLLLTTRTEGSKTFRSVVEFAEELIQRMSSKEPEGPSAKLRVGLHCGSFKEFDEQPNDVVPDEIRMSIGTGCNDCARLSSLGDGGMIVVSEEFVQEWYRNAGDQMGYKFYPKIGSEPIQVWVKHGAEQAIRILHQRKKRRVRPPSKVSFIEQVNFEIKHALSEVEQDFVLSIAEWTSPVDAVDRWLRDLQTSLSIRISIFAPPAKAAPVKRKSLICTPYRYHFDGDRTTPSKTSYSLRQGRGGPVAFAYRHNEPYFINNLPDYENSRTVYLSGVRVMGLTERDIEMWGNKPRAILAIPFAFSDQREPDAVLCMDCEQPVDLSNDDLAVVLGGLRDRFAGHLAALWHLRVK